MSSASAAVIGTSRNATSPTASARTPPTPSITVMPNCRVVGETGDQLACARHHRRDQYRDVAVVGSSPPRAGRSVAARTAASSLSARRTRPRSVLCAIAVAAQLGDDGKAELGRGLRRPRPRSTRCARRAPARRARRATAWSPPLTGLASARHRRSVSCPPMAWAVAGIIEGFYGRPWTWDERAEVMRFCHDRGMRHYVYAPKDDPKHRAEWRSPYKNKALDGFARLAAEDTLHVGFGISPGLSIDYDSADDRAALAAKVDQVVGVGVDLVCLALDDIPFGGADQGVGARRADDLAARPSRRPRHARARAHRVRRARADAVPRRARRRASRTTCRSRGRATRSSTTTITADQASARAAALGGRPPLVWDNYPGQRRDHDRPAAPRAAVGSRRRLGGRCCGYLANPLVQPRSSLLPLASIAAWLRGDDPLGAWAAEAEAMRRARVRRGVRRRGARKRSSSMPSSGSTTTMAGPAPSARCATG